MALWSELMPVLAGLGMAAAPFTFGASAAPAAAALGGGGAADLAGMGGLASMMGGVAPGLAAAAPVAEAGASALAPAAGPLSSLIPAAAANYLGANTGALALGGAGLAGSGLMEAAQGGGQKKQPPAAPGQPPPPPQHAPQQAPTFVPQGMGQQNQINPPGRVQFGGGGGAMGNPQLMQILKQLMGGQQG